MLTVPSKEVCKVPGQTGSGLSTFISNKRTHIPYSNGLFIIKDEIKSVFLP